MHTKHKGNADTSTLRCTHAHPPTASHHTHTHTHATFHTKKKLHFNAFQHPFFPSPAGRGTAPVK